MLHTSDKNYTQETAVIRGALNDCILRMFSSFFNSESL